MVDHIVKPIDPQRDVRDDRRWVGGLAASAPPARAGTARPTPLPQVEGLDAEQGCRRAGGNRALYSTCCASSPSATATAPARIAARWLAGPYKTAERIAHTVGRGRHRSAGCARTAAARRSSGRSARGRRRQACRARSRRPRAGGRALRGALAQAAPAPRRSPWTRASRKRERARLAELLAAADGDAVDHFERAAPALRAAPRRERFNALSRAVSPTTSRPACAPRRRHGRSGVALRRTQRTERPGTAQKPLVLIVDDTPENITLLNGLLRERYRTPHRHQRRARASRRRRSSAARHRAARRDDAGHGRLRGLPAPEGDAATRDIPVIFLTAKSEVEDEQQGFDAGAVDYITKPISPPIVLARVHTHLTLKAERERAERLLLNVLPARSPNG
jgi:CheY-like chemotaxis protein